MIYLYHILSLLLLPLYFVLLFIRAVIGKEDINRIGERFSISKYRKDGFLIWIHTASVGESLIALTLIENINNKCPKINFLVTSATLSASKILEKKLPNNAIHQFAPIDNIIFIRKFFKNWQPDLGIFVESELWPCLINEGVKYCKLLLLNARISDKSFNLWKKVPFFFQSITMNFSEIITQSVIDSQKFKQLGVNNVLNLNNIKFANKILKVNNRDLLLLKKHLIEKKIIVFASTHLEDEQVLLKIIKPLKKQFSDCYFIIIPRHPNRKNEIVKSCIQLNLTFSIRSKLEMPSLNNDLYIVDKLGELGLFFNIAYISFIGGSFKQGGHNILEPANFSNCIIFGPNMSNFANVAKEMVNNKAAIQIQNIDDLSMKLQYLMTKTNVLEVQNYQKNALKFVKSHQQILSNYLEVIMKYIPIDN